MLENTIRRYEPGGDNEGLRSGEAIIFTDNLRFWGKQREEVVVPVVVLPTELVLGPSFPIPDNFQEFFGQEEFILFQVREGMLGETKESPLAADPSVYSRNQYEDGL